MKGVTIELGGSERTLRYDLNAIALVGDKLGVLVRLAHFQEDLLAKPLPLSSFRTILWAGLLHENPDLDEELVGKWVGQENLVDVLTVFFGLFSSASPEVQEAVREKIGLSSEASEPEEAS